MLQSDIKLPFSSDPSNMSLSLSCRRWARRSTDRQHRPTRALPPIPIPRSPEAPFLHHSRDPPRRVEAQQRRGRR